MLFLARSKFISNIMTLNSSIDIQINCEINCIFVTCIVNSYRQAYSYKRQLIQALFQSLIQVGTENFQYHRFPQMFEIFSFSLKIIKSFYNKKGFLIFWSQLFLGFSLCKTNYHRLEFTKTSHYKFILLWRFNFQACVICLK